MTEFVYRASCACGWKGPVRTVAERAMILHDEDYHSTSIKRPEFHRFQRLIAVLSWEEVTI